MSRLFSYMWDSKISTVDCGLHQSWNCTHQLSPCSLQIYIVAKFQLKWRIMICNDWVHDSFDRALGSYSFPHSWWYRSQLLIAFDFHLSCHIVGNVRWQLTLWYKWIAIILFMLCKLRTFWPHARRATKRVEAKLKQKTWIWQLREGKKWNNKNLYTI